MSATKRVSCHCGAVQLEVDFPAGLGQPMRCNCSLCKRKGAIMIGVPVDSVRVVQGADQLSLYQWNTRVAEHYFCSRCGIYTHHRRRRDPGQIGINAGCIEGVEPNDFGAVPVIDGASLSLVERR
jgi:hypothetical protein